MGEWIEVDGSFGEGGGQLIRSSVALSAICQKPVHIANVREKRAKPGLQAQHLMAVRAAAELCGASLKGDEVGSTELFFTPTRDVRSGYYRFDIGTAGSTSLVLQTVLLPLALAGGESIVRVTGGTHNPMAPSLEYLEFVYLPALGRAGLEFEIASERNGFYPKGGGDVTLRFSLSDSLKALELTGRGELERSGAVITTSSLPASVSERGEAALRLFIEDEVEVVRRDKPSLGPGAAVFAYCHHQEGLAGFTALGERGKPIEKVAEECGASYERWMQSAAAVDEHLADQLVLPMAFANGRSRWRASEVTDHLRSVLWLLSHFLPVASEIEELGDGTGIVQIEP